MLQKVPNATTEQNKHKQWYVKEFQTSNLLQSEFCKLHDLSNATFYRCKKKYANH